MSKDIIQEEIAWIESKLASRMSGEAHDGYHNSMVERLATYRSILALEAIADHLRSIRETVRPSEFG